MDRAADRGAAACAGSPSFLITIDTEGDNLWSRPREITTGNARYLPRFQALCEKYGLKPTYLTNWEMANCPVFREFGRDIIRRGVGEVGMHLHAWHSPPFDSLTGDDYLHQPYLIEYPEATIREKVRIMTEALEDTFQVDMVSHRAGRWAFNDVYAKVLVENGYRVDCSVTPGVSWAKSLGHPEGAGGTDYTGFPEDAYLIDLDDISRPGDSSLLEIPVTIIKVRYSASARACGAILCTTRLGTSISRRLFPERILFQPARRRRKGILPGLATPTRLVGALEVAKREGRGYVEFMLHSSELMSGGSPSFPDGRSIERLYEDLEVLFSAAQTHFRGQTLAEYYELQVAAGGVRG